MPWCRLGEQAPSPSVILRCAFKPRPFCRFFFSLYYPLTPFLTLEEPGLRFRPKPRGSHLGSPAAPPLAASGDRARVGRRDLLSLWMYCPLRHRLWGLELESPVPAPPSCQKPSVCPCICPHILPLSRLIPCFSLLKHRASLSHVIWGFTPSPLFFYL